MLRYRIILEYNGTRYSGWQSQRNAVTVQGELMGAASRAFGEVGGLMGAGRTDAGVHALGQTAHLDIGGHPQEGVQVAAELNAQLPSDINVISAVQAPARFHARHSAVGRSYLYQISRRRSAFLGPFVWRLPEGLDIGAMRRAGAAAVGMHDFAAFADGAAEEESTDVLVGSVELAEAGEFLLIRIRASHFLRKMVRRFVGTLVEVGRGALPPTIISDACMRPAEHTLSYTAPAEGLFLEQVLYKGESYRRELLPAPAAG